MAVTSEQTAVRTTSSAQQRSVAATKRRMAAQPQLPQHQQPTISSMTHSRHATIQHGGTSNSAGSVGATGSSSSSSLHTTMQRASSAQSHSSAASSQQHSHNATPQQYGAGRSYVYGTIQNTQDMMSPTRQHVPLQQQTPATSITNVTPAISVCNSAVSHRHRNCVASYKQQLQQQIPHQQHPIKSPSLAMLHARRYHAGAGVCCCNGTC
jgi:hypothetical protein